MTGDPNTISNASNSTNSSSYGGLQSPTPSDPVETFDPFFNDEEWDAFPSKSLESNKDDPDAPELFCYNSDDGIVREGWGKYQTVKSPLARKKKRPEVISNLESPGQTRRRKTKDQSPKSVSVLSSNSMLSPSPISSRKRLPAVGSPGKHKSKTLNSNHASTRPTPMIKQSSLQRISSLPLDLSSHSNHNHQFHHHNQPRRNDRSTKSHSHKHRSRSNSHTRSSSPSSQITKSNRPRRDKRSEISISNHGTSSYQRSRNRSRSKERSRRHSASASPSRTSSYSSQPIPTTTTSRGRRKPNNTNHTLPSKDDDQDINIFESSNDPEQLMEWLESMASKYHKEKENQGCAATVQSAPLHSATRRTSLRRNTRNISNASALVPSTNSAPNSPHSNKSRRYQKKLVDAAAFAAAHKKAMEESNATIKAKNYPEVPSTLSLDVVELAEKGLIRVGEDGKLKLVLDVVDPQR